MSTTGYKKQISEIVSEIERLIERGDYPQALAELRDADGKIGLNLYDSVRFLEVKGRILNLMGDYKNALETAEEAYQRARHESDNELIARIQTQTAKAYLALGETEFARREYRDVIAAHRRSGNLTGLIDTLNRLAQISFIGGDFKEAVRLLNEALEYARKQGLSDRVASLTGNLGQISSMLGDFNQAVKYITISIQKNTELNRVHNLCRACLSLAYAELRLSNFDSARKSLKKAFGLIEKHNLTREYGIYHEYLAELEFELGNHDEALAQIKKALDYALGLSDASAMISQSLRLKAEIEMKLNRLEDARLSASRAFEMAEKIGEKLESGAACRVLAELSSVKGDKQAASDLIHRAIDMVQKSGARFDLSQAYIAAYRIFKGNLAESQHYLRLARELYAVMELDFNLNRTPQVDRNGQRDYEVSTPDGRIIKIVSSNRNIQAIMRAVDSIKNADIPILIGGETGTGKDQLAKFIHYSSIRRTEKFISVNCAAIPPELAESELFGHVKGAYTNATETKDGLIAAAAGGTLFLNEIGELPPAIQAKLLGALENKKVLRIGDHLPREVDFRLICATNRDLEEDVENGLFRQDLYFRIAVMTFELPPLAQRGNDIFELIIHFLCEKGFEIPEKNQLFTPEVKDRIQSYDWPGNIRELKNEINLLALSYPGDTEEVISKLVEKLSAEVNQFKIDKNSGLAEQIFTFERNRILEALAQADYVIRKAATILKMPEATLRSKIKRHNIVIA